MKKNIKYSSENITGKKLYLFLKEIIEDINEDNIYNIIFHLKYKGIFKR